MNDIRKSDKDLDIKLVNRDTSNYIYGKWGTTVRKTLEIAFPPLTHQELEALKKSFEKIRECRC